MCELFIHIIFSLFSLFGGCNHTFDEMQIDDGESPLSGFNINESVYTCAIQLMEVEKDEDDSKEKGKGLLTYSKCGNRYLKQVTSSYRNPYFIQHILFQSDSSPPFKTIYYLYKKYYTLIA